MKFEQALNPSSRDIDFLTQKINEETSDYGEVTPFAYFQRDNDGKILAGCNGVVLYGVIFTDQLWVDSNHRNLGFGKLLMERVHEYGLHLCCSKATVCTMSFQNAVEFYEKLGYTRDFERSGYVDGSNCIFLSKEL